MDKSSSRASASFKNFSTSAMVGGLDACANKNEVRNRMIAGIFRARRIRESSRAIIVMERSGEVGNDARLERLSEGSGDRAARFVSAEFGFVLSRQVNIIQALQQSVPDNIV